METTTPLQALALLNDAFVREQAAHLARRVAGPDPVGTLFAVALLRAPTATERTSAEAFLEAQAARAGGDAEQALVDLCQVVFNLNEFLCLD
jgi:hypothetical protein